MQNAKLGRERREGFGRDETVAPYSLVSFHLTATFCECVCLGLYLITRVTSREKADCNKLNDVIIRGELVTRHSLLRSSNNRSCQTAAFKYTSFKKFSWTLNKQFCVQEFSSDF